MWERYGDSRSDYHRELGQRLLGISISPSSVWNIFLFLALTATSDAPEAPRPGRFGRTFYFDIISYFTLKWDKWNCSLPSAFFHRSFSISPIGHYVEIRFQFGLWVVNMILVKLKCSLSTHRSLCLFEGRYWIWNYLERRRIYRPS